MSEILKKTREICQLLEIKPARSKGQNFLINEKIYDEIVKVAEISEDDVVLEVGPGLGFLTARLGEKARRVIAVELDDKIAAYLNMAIAAQDIENITIINEDVLRFNLGAFFKENGFKARQKYKIVANLPYNISSIFLRTFLSSQLKPESITLMLQKEVANRIIAQAPDNNLLALSVAFYGEAKIIREVKAGNFWPEPKVDSAVIKINLNQNNNWRDFLIANKIIKTSNKKEDLVLEQEILNLEKKFFRMLKISFSAKRKMLKNNLASGLEIKPLELEKSFALIETNFKIRAEDLSLEDFKKLFATIYKFMI